MPFLVTVFVTIGLASTYYGAVILAMVLRRPKAPPIPTARDLNVSTGQRVGGNVARGVATLGKSVGFVIGSVLVAWPWVVVYAIFELGRTNSTR